LTVKLSKYLSALLLLVSQLAIGQLPGRLGGRGNMPGATTGQQRPSTNGNTSITDASPTQGQAKKGKILNDSTKQIYSTATVRYFLEEDILNNKYYSYKIDSLTTYFHRFSFVKNTANLYQDIGNMGTAAYSVFYKPTMQIGTQLGYNAYDLYSQQSGEIRYFDTKSPFTNMYYGSGGRGENLFRFDHSRSLNSRFNIGTQLQTFSSRKQFGSIGSTGSQAVRHWNAVLHGSFFSKDSNYVLLANFNYTTHQNNDDGGVIITSDISGGIASEDPMLQNVQTLETRKQVHVYQQYALASGFQLFHVLDLKRQNNSYTDPLLSTGFANGIYKSITAADTTNNLPDGDALHRRYGLVQNKIGIKGYHKGFNYRLHLLRRDYGLADSLDHKYLPNSRLRRSENMLGAWVNYYFADSTRVYADAEYRLGADYRLHAEYNRKKIVLGLQQVSVSPTLLQQGFYSSVAKWSTDFKNQFSNTFYAKLRWKHKNHHFEPQASYSILANHIYADTLYNPKQESKLITFMLTSLKHQLNYKKIYTENQLFVATHTGPNRLRYPRVMLNSRLSYNFTYAQKLGMTVGLELNYKSNYYAYSYMPATQQFYLQDKIKVKPGVTAEAFLATKLNNVRLMIKYAQLNQLILGNYFIGPNFKGLKGGLSFAVSWPLFD
jgi:hypothetical protein